MTTNSALSPNIILHQSDLPASVLETIVEEVSIDTETMGLNLARDRLCLVQLKAKNSPEVHLIQFPAGKEYHAPNLSKLLQNPQIIKVYHYARFDIAALVKYLSVVSTNNYCTKIASFLARTYTNRHGLKELCNELLNISLNKQQQTSDWGAEKLTEEQKTYAANDVLYLSQLKEKLNTMLQRERKLALAKTCFEFLATRAMLDILGWEKIDIFSHSLPQP